MKDSILKGTGNSRFLKSAIPDGTTWAEALAMLRAGTFPMDLNGINNAGFQQVGTPLNKANLLKDVNALTLGLTGDATPDDMFNVLAHAGDLHVWKKTTNGVVTYPVSTNRNAYQEGDDAKPAGYTLGEVVTGKYYLGNANVGYVMSYKTATSLSVSDDGILSMPTDATSFNVTYSKNGLTTDQIKSYFAGKFVQLVAVGSDSVFSPSSLFKTAPSEILFIPSNSVVTKDEFKNFNIDRYQPVTGYAAIPANTTIEYLGCLGEKARMQVVSYVGIGTAGINHKNSLTFDFAPKLIIISSVYNSGYSYVAIIIPGIKNGIALSAYQGGQSRTGYSIISEITDKTVNWYSESYADAQMNTSGTKYMAIAIG